MSKSNTLIFVSMLFMLVMLSACSQNEPSNANEKRDHYLKSGTLKCSSGFLSNILVNLNNSSMFKTQSGIEIHHTSSSKILSIDECEIVHGVLPKTADKPKNEPDFFIRVIEN
jgi:hypothetical protein